jgi:predicted dehydrogenase
MSTLSDIAVGVAGTGFIGPAHIEALRRNHIRVVGLAEKTQEAAVDKAAELGIPRAFGSFEDMAADPEIDVVHLATPNYLHYVHAKEALLQGKHVVCEKPLAMNSTQSAELVALAAKQKRVNAVNFNIRFYPMMHQARAMLKQSALGDRIYIVQGSYLQDWLLFDSDWNWRLEPDLGGDLRAVGDIGSHWLDLVTFVTGLKIERVFADFKTFLPVRKRPAQAQDTFGGIGRAQSETVDQPIYTEDYASILLQFQNGARGVLTVSQVSAGRKNRLLFEISGSRSSLGWNSERPNELWIGHRTAPNQTMLKDPSLLDNYARQVTSYPGGHNEGFPDTFKQLYARIYAYLMAGDFNRQPDFPTFEDGHYILLLGEAIQRSAREGRWIEIETP